MAAAGAGAAKGPTAGVPTKGPSSTAGAPTKADNRAMKARARSKNDASAAAYASGQRGETPGFFDSPEEEKAFSAGRDEHAAAPAGPAGTGPPAAPTARKPSPSPRSGGGSSWSGGRRGGLLSPPSVQDPAGAVLALIAYAIGINFIKGGMPQVRKWFAAKFLNAGGASGSSSGSNATVDPGNVGQGTAVPDPGGFGGIIGGFVPAPGTRAPVPDQGLAPLAPGSADPAGPPVKV